jgi:cell division protease FtsH
MATQTPQRANATARATLAQAEQLFHTALDASARLGGRALRALGRILSGRWPLVVAVIVAAVAIWLLATRAPAALLFIGQVVVIVVVLLAALGALLWALARPRLRWAPPNGAHDAHDSALSEASGSPAADEAARRIAALLRGMKGGDAASGEISRGLLLVGPDVVGKRALARRISAESGAPLGYVSAASFHTSALGLDAWAMRSVIRAARRRARSHGASILYLDHLDLVSAGARAELLAQLDSPGAAALALTIGATPAHAALDPALLRPGRFDLQIELAAPTDAQRAAVIACALSQTPHDDTLPLARLVTDMRGYTPTEIMRAVNEALALAHGAGRERATAQDFEAACAAHAGAHSGSGVAPVNALTATEKRRLAYAAAGRVVALATLEPQEPVAHLTIRAPRERAQERRAGAPEMAPRSADEIFAAMQIALASRVAQEVFLQARLTDASDDLAEATTLALGCVARWGLGESLIATSRAPSDERLLADPIVREQVEAATPGV